MNNTPLQQFFSDYSVKRSLQKGCPDLDGLAHSGTYADAADLIRSLLLRSEGTDNRFEPVIEMWQASLIKNGLTKLVREDPFVVQGLQANGISFLEYVKNTHREDEKFPSRSLFAMLTDFDDDLRDRILDCYDPRLALDNLIERKVPVGCSIEGHYYHCDLVARLMDVIQTPGDERAIIDYLDRCLPHLKEGKRVITPDLNWGVYLHPKASPMILSWIEENHDHERNMDWNDGVSAELCTAFDKPFAVIRDMASRGIQLDPDEVLDKVAKVAGVMGDDRHLLTWLLSPMPLQLREFFDGLSDDQRYEVLAFGACHTLPMKIEDKLQYWSKSHAMVQVSFIELAGDSLSEQLCKDIMEWEFSRFNWTQTSWSVPAAIQAYPEYFLEMTSTERNWSAYKAASYAVEAMTALTEPVPNITEEFIHAGIKVSLGPSSVMNPNGIFIHTGKTREDFEGFRKALIAYVTSAGDRDLELGTESNAEPRAERRAKMLHHSFKDMAPEKAMRMIIFGLLDEQAEQAALANPETVDLMNTLGIRDEIIRKMSSNQQESQLAIDLGL
jgi:hypothetical protein